MFKNHSLIVLDDIFSLQFGLREENIKSCSLSCNKLGISTHEFTMMITLSLRFIPTLLFEADKLQKAQVSRGATFEGNIFQKIKSVIPLILPLFISVFRRADELALAMDARCYIGGKGRTSFKELVFKRNDYYIMLGALGFFILFIIFK